jgi:hypothetical protein
MEREKIGHQLEELFKCEDRNEKAVLKIKIVLKGKAYSHIEEEKKINFVLFPSSNL